MILPVLCIFSRDAALVLVDVLLTLLGCLGGPRGRCSQASVIIEDRILLSVSLKVVGKLGRDRAVVFLGVPGFLDSLGVARLGSNLSTGVLTRSDLRLVMVPALSCSVIIKVSFSGSASASILSSASLEAPEVSEVVELALSVFLVSFCSADVKPFFSGSASILSSASLEAPEASEAAELNLSSSVAPGRFSG